MKKPIKFQTLSIEKVAALVSEKLAQHKIDSILVGGACVSIYSQNRYQSYDLDYVTYADMKQVAKALKELGFEKKGKYFFHSNCDFFIEFVNPPVAIGDKPVEYFENYKTPLGTIKMLTPTDSVKDRLASYYHWDDIQSLDQAISVCEEKLEAINIKDIKDWSKQEGHSEKFQHFLKEFKQINS